LLVKKIKNSEYKANEIQKKEVKKTLEFTSLQEKLESFGLRTKTKAHSITIEFKNTESIDHFLEKIK